MSREHLYKAKRVNWKELPKAEWWVYGYYAEIGGKSTIIERKCDTVCFVNGKAGKGNKVIEVHPETVCEYTGLSDVNGRRFEGDIFQADNGECTQIYIIVWDDQCLEWYAECIGDPDGTLPLCEFRVDEIEVIGNIFDNLGNIFGNSQLVKIREAREDENK